MCSRQWVAGTVLGLVVAGISTAGPALGADDIDSLVNASFQTSWTYRSGGVPSPPGGWTLAGWGATAGGPQYYTGAELSSGRPSDHRCKWEFASTGVGTNNVIAKEVNWGPYTQATITVYCAGRTWGGHNGDMKLGVDADGGGTQWSHCGTTVTRTSNDQTWAQLTRVVDKPGQATTFTVMLNAVPGGTKWNCQFDELVITGSNPCTPPPTPGAPMVNGATTSTLNVANNAGDSGTAYFAIRINGGGFTNKYVQANGSVGDSAVWQTKATWYVKTVTGLAPSTTYTFDLKAANDASGTCPTSFGPSSQGTTLCQAPATPGAPTVNGAACTTPNVANNAGDSGTAYFAIRINGGGYSNKYVQANGSVGDNTVWQTKSAWGTKTVTGLASGTQYTFDVKAANDASGSCPTGFGAASSGTTAAVPSAPTGGWGDANSTSVITWSWNLASGSGNVYRVYDAASGGNLKATSGTDATSVAETGLAVNTQYSRWVATYKSCESASRLALPATYTFAAVPAAPTVGGPTNTTLNVGVNENGNPSSTTFAIKCVQGGNVKFVQANGTLGAGEVFQTKATWGTKTVTGLSQGTTYVFSVCARNGDGIITSYSPTTEGTTTSGCGGESADSLSNADFQTSWTYRSGGVPSAPSGWTLGDWGATAGGPQYLSTSGDCYAGRVSDHRCKYEMANSGAGTDNMLYKEVLWGSYSQATVTVYAAQHSWSGGSGTQSLGVKDGGCGTAWSQRTHTTNNGAGECSWVQLSLNVTRPQGAPSFTVMLNGRPNGSTGWNCQFDKLQVSLSGGFGTIAGNVKDGSGVNVPGATVSTNVGGYSAVTDNNGNYTINNVAVGTYNVTASKTGYNPQTQTGKSVTAGQTTTVNFTITLQTGNGSITGKLRDVHMVAISGATVTTTPSSTSAVTAADGSFTLTNVPAYTYSVNYAKTGYQTGIWYNVTVTPGQQVSLPDKLVPRSCSKIGAHVTYGSRTGWGDFLQQTHNCGKGCQLVKCLDDFGASNDMYNIAPEGLRVGRMNQWCGHDLQGMDYAVGNDPAVMAQTVYNCVVTTWNLNPHVEVWEIFNEWSSHWAWQADFLIAMMDIAEANGRRIALFGCSAGNPPEDSWSEIARACARAKAHGGHMLSLHEYAWNDTLQAEYNLVGDLTVLRYRRLYEYLREANADCPLILTEVGNHGGGGFIGDIPFVNDMAWYDNQCRLDDYVLGIASWTLGEWGGANWQTALPEMADYICSH